MWFSNKKYFWEILAISHTQKSATNNSVQTKAIILGINKMFLIPFRISDIN